MDPPVVGATGALAVLAGAGSVAGWDGALYLTASTVHRWLDKAGVEAERTVPGQLSGVAISRQMGTDGLWARLRDELQRVALAVVDYVSGVVWPTAVVEREEKEEGWGQLFQHGLLRIAPEWLWRDLRLQLSRGRNHGSEQRVQRAMLVWAIYRNFMPAQWRSEHKRRYRRPGQSPLTKVGIPPEELSYLDALRV